MGEILVLAEHRQKQLREITFEMLALARRLADEKGLEVTALLPSQDRENLAPALASACDRLLVIEDGELANCNVAPYVRVLQQVLDARKPLLTLIGHTAAGMEIAPAIAARLSLPLVTDCIDLRLTDDSLTAVRQMYGGKINADLVMKPFERYVATVRPGSFSMEGLEAKSAQVETLPAPDWGGSLGRRFLGYVEAEAADVDIAAADILVSIGRGIGKPENVPLAQEFAEAIGASLSCSRPVADEGWLPKSRQVGTSGKTVRPKIYIALGISGAYQHQAGMKNAETIIAVNTDPQAPIFSVAHYGIIGDVMQVLPVLKKRFSK